MTCQTVCVVTISEIPLYNLSNLKYLVVNRRLQFKSLTPNETPGRRVATEQLVCLKMRLHVPVIRCQAGVQNRSPSGENNAKEELTAKELQYKSRCPSGNC